MTLPDAMKLLARRVAVLPLAHEAYDTIMCAYSAQVERAERAEKELAESEALEKAEIEQTAEERAALRRSVNEWMRRLLGADEYSRLWGQPLEALGRGVDDLRHDLDVALAREAALRAKVETLAKRWEQWAANKYTGQDGYRAYRESVAAEVRLSCVSNLRSLLAPAGGTDAGTVARANAAQGAATTRETVDRSGGSSAGEPRK